MSDILTLLVFVHLLPVALALWGVFQRAPWIHVPATLILASELLGFFMANFVSVDGIGGAPLAMIVFGPILAPVELWQAAAEAPVWVVPLFALGAAGSIAVWRLLWRRTKLRISAAAGLLAGAALTWIVSEIAVEATLRIQAGRQFAGYCNFHRLPAPLMLTAGLSDFGVPSHAELEDRSDHYIWSFKQNRWVKHYACIPGGCRCSSGSLPDLSSPPANS